MTKDQAKSLKVGDKLQFLELDQFSYREPGYYDVAEVYGVWIGDGEVGNDSLHIDFFDSAKLRLFGSSDPGEFCTVDFDELLDAGWIVLRGAVGCVASDFDE